MFAPAHADRNQWSTEGVGHDEQDLHDALRRALLYYDDTREDVPPTTKFHERWMGQKDGEWYICDEAGYIVSDGPLHGWTSLRLMFLEPFTTCVCFTVSSRITCPWQVAPVPTSTSYRAARGKCSR